MTIMMVARTTMIMRNARLVKLVTCKQTDGAEACDDEHSTDLKLKVCCKYLMHLYSSSSPNPPPSCHSLSSFSVQLLLL